MDDVEQVLSERVAALSGLDACVVFGSVARGTQRSDSDIDVMLVGDDPLLAERLRTGLDVLQVPAASWSVSSISSAGVASRRKREPSFMAHLALEGRVIWASTQWSVPAAYVTPVSVDEIAQEVWSRFHRVSATLDPRRLGGNYVPALSRIYSSAKSICMARTVPAEPDFDWATTFASFGDVHPQLAGAARRLADLRPYYLRMRGHEVAVSDGDGRHYEQVVADLGAIAVFDDL